MDLTSELNRHFIDRKWCQLLLSIQKNCTTHTDICLSFITTHLKELFDKSDIISLTNLISLITDITSQVSLVESMLKHFDSLEFKSLEQEESAFITKLNYDILTFKSNSKIYEYFKCKIPVSAEERFYYLMYLYFDYVDDSDQCYKYLALYCDKLKEKEDDYYKEKRVFLCNKLGELALKAEDVYYFDDILINITDPELKTAVMAYSNGNIDLVKKSKHTYALEKAYLISLVKLCVYKKSISLKEISDALLLDYENCLFYMYKALGKGLIKGYYNGKNNQLYLYKSINKAVSESDIKEMKSRFEEWRIKVNEQIG